MTKETHKKAEHCYEKNCREPVYCKGQCQSHYRADYYRRNKKLWQISKERQGNAQENKLTIDDQNYDRPRHIKHENSIFVLAAGTDYKRMPYILTSDNYEQERTVGNS